MKRIIPTIIFVAALAIIAVGMLKPWIGDVTETWETENQTFKLRVDQRAERCGFLCGAYYVFQSAPVGPNAWREIMVVHHDDPNPIPRDNVRFVNAQIGYVFFGSKYAVTTDAGQNWHVWDAWDAKKEIPFEKWKLYPSIAEVSVEVNGHGRMRLYSSTDKPVDQPELRTNDYGQSWRVD